jgi:hypothetical protein
MLNEIRNRGWMLMWLAFGVPGLLLLTTTAQSQTAAPPAGALIRMEMNSVVGVKLDDIPAGTQREAAADWALSQEDDFWEKRASAQVNLTYYRLVFRAFFYTAPVTALPLPPLTSSPTLCLPMRVSPPILPALAARGTSHLISPPIRSSSYREAGTTVLTNSAFLRTVFSKRASIIFTTRRAKWKHRPHLHVTLPASRPSHASMGSRTTSD